MKTSIIWSATKETLEKIVETSTSFTEALGKLGLTLRGHANESFKKRLEQDNIDYSKLYYKLSHPDPWHKIELNEILVKNSAYKNQNALKKRLLKAGILKNQCYNQHCNLPPIWNKLPLSLQIDHINGICSDNRIENLRILCPNCHSQTLTYSGKNKEKSSKIKKQCIECESTIPYRSKGLCRKCSDKQKTLKIIKLSISREELISLLNKYPITTIGKMLNVSGNAISKRCKKLGIEKPKYPRGYWLRT
jgi:hypothetical protein